MHSTGDPSSTGSPRATIDVVLPVHNEGASIGATLREFHRTVAVESNIPIRFVVCEDGSSDDTLPVVRALAAELPLKLISDPVRKGYSRAVIDGLRASESDWVACIDSDGQCDPADFAKLLVLQDGADLVVGWRNPRSDPWMRRAMSGAFGLVYRTFFDVRLRDPSCPYILIRRASLEKILAGNVGILKQGFWWEFFARASALGLAIRETPVHHRVRSSGTTQVYRPARVPRIALEHLLGLRRLRQELNAPGARPDGFPAMASANDLLRKFALYVVIGAGAFTADYAVFLVLFLASGNPYIANVAGICVGMTVSFSLNRKFNFRKPDAPARRAARFVTVAALGMAVSTLILMLLISFGVDARISKVIAMLLVFSMQFLMNALWTFR